jgi:hypothetical protein
MITDATARCSNASTTLLVPCCCHACCCYACNTACCQEHVKSNPLISSAWARHQYASKCSVNRHLHLQFRACNQACVLRKN